MSSLMLRDGQMGCGRLSQSIYCCDVESSRLVDLIRPNNTPFMQDSTLGTEPRPHSPHLTNIMHVLDIV